MENLIWEWENKPRSENCEFVRQSRPNKVKPKKNMEIIDAVEIVLSFFFLRLRSSIFILVFLWNFIGRIFLFFVWFQRKVEKFSILNLSIHIARSIIAFLFMRLNVMASDSVSFRYVFEFFSIKINNEDTRMSTYTRTHSTNREVLYGETQRWNNCDEVHRKSWRQTRQTRQTKSNSQTEEK